MVPAPAASRPAMSLSTKILIGLGGGVAFGLFAGEYAGHLNVIGEAFIGILQMTVLPYIVASLIANIGRLSPEQARRLLRVGGSVLAIFLLIGAAALCVIPLSFPPLVSASFFSRNLVERRPPIDVLGLYIPTNPFNALSTGTVPAIIVFSIAVGVGLIPVANKADVIRVLDTVAEALIRINKIAVKLTPIGVFAIAAAAAGTMTLEEIGKLQAYLLSYSVAVAVLTFLILPALVSAVTPFRAGEIFRVFGDTMLLIFVTGKLIVVMPQLIESVKEMFWAHEQSRPDVMRDADLMVPLIYPFPNLGTFIIFMFVPFTAWYAGRPLEQADYPLFLTASLLVSFISPVAGIPFLLDLLRLPGDMFQLFIASSVYTDRVRVVLGGMDIFAFAVISVAALHGMFRVRWNRVAGYSLCAAGIVAIGISGVRGTLSRTLTGSYTKDKVLSQMTLLDPPVETRVAESAPNPTPLESGEGLLGRIRRRGALRFGYDAQRIPFCFVNSSGEVVGLDIELMNRLAQTLKARLELVPVTRESMAEQAAADHFDFAGCGYTLTSARSAALSLSAPYLDLHAALIVAPYRRHELDTLAKFTGQKSLTVGVASDDEFVEVLQTYIPRAKIVRLRSVTDFLDGRRPEVQAFFTNAETACAMTLLRPSFAVVSPADLRIVTPSVFVLSRNDPAATQFINDWILLRQKNGAIERVYDYWILGKRPEGTERRWSVVRDVLGWVR
jgi:Na+/H+-dicarboxylate symporter